jgi:hypothetical protein
LVAKHEASIVIIRLGVDTIDALLAITIRLYG